MQGFGLLQIAVFLAVAVVAAPLARQLKIGSVLGYLVAGFLIGPFGLGFIYQLYAVENIRHVGEFGVVMLLFVIGLELRPKRIWSMRSAIFGLGGAQVGGTGLLLSGFMLAFGYPLAAAIFIGLSLALSSTAFALQVLEEKGELNTQHGRNAFSVLLFQDLAAIPLLALVPLFAIKSAGAGGMSVWSAATALVTIVGIIAVGHYLLNEVYRFVAATKVREAMTASALLTVVGVALAMEHAGLSAAMGAFIAGVILADSEFRHQIEADLAPFVGLLLGLFFITIGMSLDVNVLKSDWVSVLLLTVLLVGVKFTVMYALALRRGMNDPASRRLAIVLSQGGEFAFVLLATGAAAGVLEPAQAKLITLAVTFSMMSTPLLLLLDDRAYAASPPEPVRAYDKPRGKEGHIIIAGLGRYGQTIARVLRARKLPFIALDINAARIDALRAAGYTGYYGDASKLGILRAARIDKAAGIVIAIDDAECGLKIARIVRQQYPDVRVFARARDRHHALQFLDLGVTMVRRETFLSAVETTSDVLIEAYGEDKIRVARDMTRLVNYDHRRLFEEHHQTTTAAERGQQRAPCSVEELEELFADDLGAGEREAAASASAGDAKR